MKFRKTLPSIDWIATDPQEGYQLKFMSWNFEILSGWPSSRIADHDISKF